MSGDSYPPMWILPSLPLCYGIWNSSCDAEGRFRKTATSFNHTQLERGYELFLRVLSCPFAKLCSRFCHWPQGHNWMELNTDNPHEDLPAPHTVDKMMSHISCTRTFRCLQQAPRFPVEINTSTNEFSTFLLRNSTPPQGEFSLGQSLWCSQPSIPSSYIHVTLSILFSWMKRSMVNSVACHFELESWRERIVDNSKRCSWSSLRALSNILKVSQKVNL